MIRKAIDEQYEEKSIKQNVQKKKYDKINAGDEVKVLSYVKREVLELVGEDEAVVQMGIIKMKLPIEDLEKTKKKRKPTKMVTAKIDKRSKPNLI